MKRSNKQEEKFNLTRGQRSSVHLFVPTFILESQVKASTTEQPSTIDNGLAGDKTQLNKLLFPFYVSTLISINSIHNLCLIKTNTQTHTLAQHHRNESGPTNRYREPSSSRSRVAHNNKLINAAERPTEQRERTRNEN